MTSSCCVAHTYFCVQGLSEKIGIVPLIGIVFCAVLIMIGAPCNAPAASKSLSVPFVI